MSFNTKRKYQRAFTLIELLVVVAIIGILATIVIASLNSARNKGKATAIKSNLRNMIAQMEISYLDNGNYGGLNTGGDSWRPNTNCLSTSPINNMISSVTNSSAIVRCHSSLNYSTWGESRQRWGVTVLIPSDTAPIEAYSTSQQGVVKWDEKGVDTTGEFVTGDDVRMIWTQAVTACSLSGGRLPTIEELKTLADTECERLGNESCIPDTTRNPPGFVASHYWSGTAVPSNSSNAYSVYLGGGNVGSDTKLTTRHVRCVR